MEVNSVAPLPFGLDMARSLLDSNSPVGFCWINGTFRFGFSHEGMLNELLAEGHTWKSLMYEPQYWGWCRKNPKTNEVYISAGSTYFKDQNERSVPEIAKELKGMFKAASPEDWKIHYQLNYGGAPPEAYPFIWFPPNELYVGSEGGTHSQVYQSSPDLYEKSSAAHEKGQLIWGRVWPYPRKNIVIYTKESNAHVFEGQLKQSFDEKFPDKIAGIDENMLAISDQLAEQRAQDEYVQRGAWGPRYPEKALQMAIYKHQCPMCRGYLRDRGGFYTCDKCPFEYPPGGERLSSMLHEIPTALTNNEVSALIQLAQNKIVLEVGALLGYSTINFAQVAKQVFSIDPHEGYPPTDPRPTYEPFLQNLKDNGVRNKVQVNRGTDEQRLPVISNNKFDLVFVDASGLYEDTKRILNSSIALLRPRGTIAVHDYGSQEWTGVTQAVDEFKAQTGFGFQVIDQLAILTNNQRTATTHEHAWGKVAPGHWDMVPWVYDHENDHIVYGRPGGYHQTLFNHLGQSPYLDSGGKAGLADRKMSAGLFDLRDHEVHVISGAPVHEHVQRTLSDVYDKNDLQHPSDPSTPAISEESPNPAEQTYDNDQGQGFVGLGSTSKVSAALKPQPTGTFGYINGHLIRGNVHHQGIMAALIEKGWTWKDLMDAQQAWGWYYTIGNPPEEHIYVKFTSDSGFQHDDIKPEVLKAFESAFGIPTEESEYKKGIVDPELYGNGLSGKNMFKTVYAPGSIGSQNIFKYLADPVPPPPNPSPPVNTPGGGTPPKKANHDLDYYRNLVRTGSPVPFVYIKGTLFFGKNHSNITTGIVNNGWSYEHLAQWPQIWGWVRMNAAFKLEVRFASDDKWMENKKNLHMEDEARQALNLWYNNTHMSKIAGNIVDTDGVLLRGEDWYECCYGWVDGTLYIGDVHHAKIIAGLIKDGVHTWETMVNAKQMWGWINVEAYDTYDYDDHDQKTKWEGFISFASDDAKQSYGVKTKVVASIKEAFPWCKKWHVNAGTGYSSQKNYGERARVQYLGEEPSEGYRPFL